MVVADARTLKQSSLAHTVRDQGLRLRQLEQKQDAQLEELQAENLRLRSTVHDLAESLSALVAAVLPRCPAAASGGLVPTAVTIAAAAADAAALQQSAAPAVATSTALVPPRVPRPTSAPPSSAPAQWPNGQQLERQSAEDDPALETIVDGMRDLAAHIQELPREDALLDLHCRTMTASEGVPSPAALALQTEGMPPRPVSAPPKKAAAKAEPSKSTLARAARPQSAPGARPARPHRDERTDLSDEDRAEARHAAAVARDVASTAHTTLLPSHRTAVRGVHSSAEVSSSVSEASADGGGVRQETEEEWMARQPGGARGHLAYIKARTQNPAALVKEVDKRALQEKEQDAQLKGPPVQWVTTSNSQTPGMIKSEEGWGRWVAAEEPEPEPEQQQYEDAVQLSHTQLRSFRKPSGAVAPRAHSRPQSAPAKGRQQRRSKTRSRSTRQKRPASAAVRSCAPLDETEEAGLSWQERSDWRKEQAKWSSLAKGALRSMESDSNLTDLALMVRTMEEDPRAAATVLGEAALAAADAALCISEEQAAAASTKRNSSTREAEGRRGWGAYLKEREKRGGEESGADELAGYYDWLLRLQQDESRTSRGADESSSDVVANVP